MPGGPDCAPLGDGTGSWGRAGSPGARGEAGSPEAAILGALARVKVSGGGSRCLRGRAGPPGAALNA